MGGKLTKKVRPRYRRRRRVPKPAGLGAGGRRRSNIQRLGGARVRLFDQDSDFADMGGARKKA